MAIREIITLPDQVLRRKARKVTQFGPELHTLIDDLVETEVIWRNADPFDASDEDAAILEEISRGITP